LRESVSTEENLADENPVLKDPAMTGLLGHGEVVLSDVAWECKDGQ